MAPKCFYLIPPHHNSLEAKELTLIDMVVGLSHFQQPNHICSSMIMYINSLKSIVHNKYCLIAHQITLCSLTLIYYHGNCIRVSNYHSDLFSILWCIVELMIILCQWFRILPKTKIFQNYL